MLGTLRAGGFTLRRTAHAYAVIDAFVVGFALQEASLPATPEAHLPGLLRGSGWTWWSAVRPRRTDRLSE
jgi:hypothetical protein